MESCILRLSVLFLVVVGFPSTTSTPCGWGLSFQALNTGGNPELPSQASLFQGGSGVPDPALIPASHSLLLEHAFTPHNLSTPKHLGHEGLETQAH